MIAFVICSIVALIFLIIGINTYKCNKVASFFTFCKPCKLKNIKAYNNAVGKLWFIFAITLEILGIPFLYFKQNSPIFVFTVFCVLVLVIGVFIRYLQIEERYKE